MRVGGEEAGEDGDGNTGGGQGVVGGEGLRVASGGPGVEAEEGGGRGWTMRGFVGQGGEGEAAIMRRVVKREGASRGGGGGWLEALDLDEEERAEKSQERRGLEACHLMPVSVVCAGLFRLCFAKADSIFAK